MLFRSTLVDVDTAYRAAVYAGIEGYAAGNLAGPVTGGLYSYYNSAYGQIHPDGTVKLTCQGTPVWLFIAPLNHHVNDSVGPPAGASPAYPEPHRVQLHLHRGCRIRQPADQLAALHELLTTRVLAHCSTRAPLPVPQRAWRFTVISAFQEFTATGDR